MDDDFELITFDFVTEPSTRGAYLAPVQKRYKRPVPDQGKASDAVSRALVRTCLMVHTADGHEHDGCEAPPGHRGHRG